MQGVRNSIGCLVKHVLKQVGETKHFFGGPVEVQEESCGVTEQATILRNLTADSVSRVFKVRPVCSLPMESSASQLGHF